MLSLRLIECECVKSEEIPQITTVYPEEMCTLCM